MYDSGEEWVNLNVLCIDRAQHDVTEQISVCLSVCLFSPQGWFCLGPSIKVVDIIVSVRCLFCCKAQCLVCHSVCRACCCCLCVKEHRWSWQRPQGKGFYGRREEWVKSTTGGKELQCVERRRGHNQEYWRTAHKTPGVSVEMKRNYKQQRIEGGNSNEHWYTLAGKCYACRILAIFTKRLK